MFNRSFGRMALALGLCAAPAIGEAITYQGQLRDAGEPANGGYDMSFQLYGSPAGADAIGQPLALTGVSVADGLFTTQLDFGVSLHTSSPRWMQIKVNGQALSPRVEMTAAPFALNTRGLSVLPNGRTGVGVGAPRLSLDVGAPSQYGAPAIGGFNGTHHAYLHIGPDHHAMIWDAATSLRFGSEATLGVGFAERMRITGDGRVGIGTQTPAEPLHVVGADNDGVNAAVRIDSGVQTLLIDGNEIDSNATNGLFLNNNTPHNIALAAGGGKVGIGTGSAYSPLTFRNDLGAKISLLGNATNSYGLGVQSSRLLVHSDSVNSDIAFGFGSSDSFAENVRFKGTGEIGVGTATPYAPLTFANELGAKVSLYGTAASSYGFGVQSNELQMHTDVVNSDITFGHGDSDSFTENVRFKGNGRVGIGTDTPTTRLEVSDGSFSVSNSGGEARMLAAVNTGSDAGFLQIFDTNNALLAGLGGNDSAGGEMFVRNAAGQNSIFLSGGTGELSAKIVTITGGSDIAEPYDVAPSGDARPAPGMIVSIDAGRAGSLRVSDSAYDRTVAGIISGANGINTGMVLKQEGTLADGTHPIALSGRVWAWCDADASGPIQPGDLLTTSPTPGHAMKAGDAQQSPGATIGKAMSKLEKGRGLVLVLVSLQ